MRIRAAGRVQVRPRFERWPVVNAGILAAQILGAGNTPEAGTILDRLAKYKNELREMVLSKKLPKMDQADFKG